jgi:phosphoglycerol transferase MdoB-like AlkP superfamily enzyme
VPLLIRLPHRQAAAVHLAPGGQVDLLPTLAHLLGVSAQGSFGRDLMAPGEANVVLRGGSLVLEDTFVDADDEQAYELVSEQPLPDYPAASRLACATRQLRYSNMIVRHNLIRRVRLAP